jgi:hypothetical protein
MKYTVVWKPAPQNELALLWLHAPDRDAIAKAADEAEQLLAADPLNLGESRSGGMRVFFVDQLGFTYSVSTEDRLVSVLRVWHFT